MNRSSAQRNIESLTLVAHRLDNLCDQVTFVGGSIMGLLITDKAAPDVRFTVDVDCIIDVITQSGYYTLAKKLRKKGFKEMSTGNHPICRWSCDGILIDIMPTDKSVLGFSNKWYKDQSIINIAIDAGFESHEAFSLAFKQTCGISPSEFRQKSSWQVWEHPPYQLPQKEDMAMNVTIKNMNPRRLAVLEHRGNPKLVGDSVNKLINWAKAQPINLKPKAGEAYRIVN